MVEMVTVMFAWTPDNRSPILSQPMAIVTASVSFLVFLSHWLMRHSSLERLADRCHWGVKTVVLGLMIFLIVMARARDRAFIYFQF